MEVFSKREINTVLYLQMFPVTWQISSLFFFSNCLQIHPQTQRPDPGRGQTQSTVSVVCKMPSKVELSHIYGHSLWPVQGRSNTSHFVPSLVLSLLEGASQNRRTPEISTIDLRSIIDDQSQIRDIEAVSANRKAGHFTSQSLWDESQKANISQQEIRKSCVTQHSLDLPALLF